MLVGREVGGRWKIYRKDYAEGARRMLKTILNDNSYHTERGQKEFNALFSTRAKLFSSPKSPYLLAQLIETATGTDDLVLDFFAGSGTTGHAVMKQNAVDNGHRRYILVQLPELLDPADVDQRPAAEFLDKLGKPRNIAEIAKERLRRAAAKINDENRTVPGDLGFRVFKLDTSNIHAWEPDRDALEATLLDNVEHIKEDRTEEDILFEVLLKLGVDLCAPIETRTIAGKTVRSADGGTLTACLAEKIDREEVESLALGMAAWNRELAPVGGTTVVFRDSAFADDIAKTNLAAILEQHGLGNVRSL